MIRFAAALDGKGNDKLIFQGVKILLDGSNQGFTGRLRPPGYLGSGANGLWNRAPEQLRELVPALHNAGLQVVAHCNGDQAAEVFIDAVADAQAERNLASIIATSSSTDRCWTNRCCAAWRASACTPRCSPTTSTTRATSIVIRRWAPSGPPP